MKKVGIIGGAGFIGSHITQKFLAEGFKVRVSATDITNKEKYQHLQGFPNAKNLEIVALNVENKDQLKSFLQDCQIVVHGGTPFKLDVQDPETELFRPTVQGTKNFLESVQQTSTVEKVVFLASIAAYNSNFPMPADGKLPEATYSEAAAPFFSESSHPYGQAKFIANQTVNQFLKEHLKLSFEVTSVSPVLVVGKPLSKREDTTSGGLQFLFKNKIAPNPFVQMLFDTDAEFAMVGVKDVADGIYKASTTTGLHGENYILSSESWKVSAISAMLNHQIPKGEGRMVYMNDLAKQRLNMTFNPVIIPLNEYGRI